MNLNFFLHNSVVRTTMSLAFAYEGNNFFDGWVYNYSATDNTWVY